MIRIKLFEIFLIFAALFPMDKEIYMNKKIVCLCRENKNINMFFYSIMFIILLTQIYLLFLFLSYWLIKLIDFFWGGGRENKKETLTLEF